MKKILLAALVLAISAPAHAAQPCLRLSQIFNWNSPNDQTLIVEDYQHYKFKLSLMGHCTGLNLHEALGFKAFGGDALSCLTAGDSVIQRDVIGPQHCPITKIELYTPEMQKADKEAAKAKGSTAP